MKKHINNLLPNDQCTGCNACKTSCPKKCISMNKDDEGFLYPKVDENTCIDCGVCSSTCPVLNSDFKTSMETAFAVVSKDEDVRSKSSSGGVMSLLADKVLNENGTVYGAAYDENYRVYHLRVDSKENLDLIRRAKYAQSDLNDVFKQVESDLQNGPVLFVGSPCQCAGLSSYINRKQILKNKKVTSVTEDEKKNGDDSTNKKREKGYQYKVFSSESCSDSQPVDLNSENKNRGTNSAGYNASYNIEDNRKYPLYLIDFVCHSIPSPEVWKKYIEWKSEKEKPESINQRSKKSGWSRYSYSIELNYPNDRNVLIPNGEDIFMKLFIGDYITRPSCKSCRFKGSHRASDLTLGDFWGIWDIDPDMDDNKGTSLAILHSEPGEDLFAQIANQYIRKQMDVEAATKQNPAYTTSYRFPENRESVLKRSLAKDFDQLESELIQPGKQKYDLKHRLRTMFRSIAGKDK